MNQILKLKKIQAYKKSFGMMNLSPVSDGDDGDFISHFNSSCDVCDSYGEVYECNGYVKKTKSISEGHQVCHECVCLEANGID